MAENEDNEGLFKAGQLLECRIIKPSAFGYEVREVVNDVRGFLSSENSYELNATVPVHFVCWDKGRMLLTDRFTNYKSDEQG